MTQEEIANSTW